MVRAVLVGIDKYKDSRIPDLHYARADAEEFARLLTVSIEASECRIRTFCDDEATKRSLAIVIGEELPRETKTRDLVLLYFAGHGCPETRSGPDHVSRYLVAHDSDYASVFATAIDLERDFLRWLERIPPGPVIIVCVDSCFSGAAGGRTFEGPRLARLPFGGRAGPSASLRQLDFGEGRLILAACDDNEVAREDKRLRHGVFTYYLMETLVQPADERTIRVTTLYNDVEAAVRQHTANMQHPIMNGRLRSTRLPRLSRK